MTAQENADAILAALNTALAPRVAYELDKVPATRPAQYVEVTLARRFGGESRQDGFIGTTGYRVIVTAISSATVSSIRSDLEKCRAALEFQSLTVGALSTTPIQFETEDEADYGNGWFAQYATYTYAI